MTSRFHFRLFLALCLAVTLFPGCKKDVSVDVMSFNIRVCPDETADGENNWLYRRDAVIKMIQETAPDMIGIQEGLFPQVNYMAENLPQYYRFGVEREDGQERGEANAIFIKKERFDVPDSGTFWLSETPDTVSLGWDGAYNRTVTWVKLIDKESGKEILFFDTHFDHIGDTARIEAGKLIGVKMKEIAGEGIPVFLTGDFNSNYDSRYLDPIREFMGNGREDAPETCDYNTFNNWGRIKLDGEMESIIDHVFYKNAEPLKYRVVAEDYGAQFISDHYPIVLTAKF
ncbi:MAG: endonuclease/exonuclease/phosphatase family protein [Bacteroidales bacterium]|nr:endonuclease/exonuclease/phosphatase family protein [Candidatus Cacconaster merdequi]